MDAPGLYGSIWHLLRKSPLPPFPPFLSSFSQTRLARTFGTKRTLVRVPERSPSGQPRPTPGIMLKSEARSSARIEYLSKVAKQEPQYEPPPSTSRTRSTHTSGAPSTRRSKTSRGGAPTYMKSKEKAGARWRSMLSEDELETVMTKDNINSGRQFSELLERLQEEPIREMARQEMLKARAEAAINPKPTHTPKPAHWRKKTFTCDVGASTEAHALFEQLAASPPPPSAPPPPEAGPKFGSKREMSTKGREWQLEKQRQMQELRKLAELRSSYKESVAVCNFEHRNRQMEYMRTPAHELRTTATDRARAKEKAKRAKEEVERAKSRSMDSRYVVAQQEAEARAAEAVNSQAATAAAARAAAAAAQERADLEGTPAVDDVMTGAADDDMPPTADDVLPPPAKATVSAAADSAVW